jgi:hypothetical protein
MDKLQASKHEKQNEFGLSPRLTISTQRVQYVMFRFSSKHVVYQVKGYVAKKNCATPDVAAWWQEREQMDSARQHRI